MSGSPSTVGLLAALPALALAALLAACEPAPRSEIGRGPAPTFVSLNPCLDALLVEIAEPDQIAALSHYSRDRAASSIAVARARQFAVTGGTAEEVIALDPDIVLASSFIAPATKAALERAGMRVETFGGVGSVAESIAQIERIGALTDGRAAAQRLLRALDNGTQAALPAHRPSALLWQAGEIVPGEASLIVQLLEQAGFANHAAARGLGQADRVSLEQVLADPPDLLLVAGESAGQLHPALRQLEAMRVHRFDPRLFYCGGPSILAAREELARIRRAMDVPSGGRQG